jgi:hypothetical protein
MKIVIDAYTFPVTFAEQTVNVCCSYNARCYCVLRESDKQKFYKRVERINVRNSVNYVTPKLRELAGIDTAIITKNPDIIEYCRNNGYPFFNYKLPGQSDNPALFSESELQAKRLAQYIAELEAFLDSLQIPRKGSLPQPRKMTQIRELPPLPEPLKKQIGKSDKEKREQEIVNAAFNSMWKRINSKSQ